jgi:hypothetical protein
MLRFSLQSRSALIALAGVSAAVLAAATPAGAAPMVAHAAAASCSTAYLPLPDSSCTPGATNPDVTPDTIDQTICVSGWTSTVRPPTSYTNPLKVKQIAAYGYADTSPSDYEEDHLIPLELGGAPRDPKNLWPEPHYGSRTSANKDSVENALKKAVCDGRVDLTDAQNAIATDWTTAESVVGIG